MENTNVKKNFNYQKGDVSIGVIIIIVVVVIALIAGGVYFFKPPKYETVTKITYSTDAGHTYREGIQEISLNQEYYMCVEMQVSASKDVNAKTIKATITLEQTEVVSCYLDDHPGQNITGELDEINHTITYTFDVPASTTPSKFRVIFRCVPQATGNFKTVIAYDDHVEPAWDKTENIRYVEE